MSLRIDERTAVVDVLHQGRAGVIGTGVIEGENAVALVDPGPEVCLPNLEAGLADLGYSLGDVGAVLLTHIHLDHATAAGAIVARVPGARVYVHPRGAVHMVDPSRLLASATRIYGDEMETLWGEFLPVPESAVMEVDEGDVIGIGGRSFEVAYTPGHAKHHVAYYEASQGTAWIGDVGGIRLVGGSVVPVTPPPDIDVEAWNESMDRVMAWNPDRLVPTHFGVVDEPRAHFESLRVGLGQWADFVRESLGSELAGGAAAKPGLDSVRCLGDRRGRHDEQDDERHQPHRRPRARTPAQPVEPPDRGARH